MTTDFDTRLSDALTDVASTTTVSDDALDHIMRRTQPLEPRHRIHRTALTVAAVVAGTAVAGVAAATVVDRLTDDQAVMIEQVPTCDVDAETARLVATTTNFGITVDYWIVDGPDVYGDFLFVDGTDTGTGGCGGMARADLRTELPWANYAFDTPVDGQARFWFYGQAPAGTVEVEIAVNTGTTRAPVTSADGHFVVLAELPYNGIDELERIDAYDANGILIATNVAKTIVERDAAAEN